MVDWNDETEQRALSLLQSPMGALQFADAFRPDQATRSVGSRSLAGHARLRRLESLGLVRRTRGATPALDTFIATSVMDAPQPGSPPQPPPELQVQPGGDVIEIQRRSVGRLAPTPTQPADGELIVDPVTGEVTRVTRERLGRAQMPAPPQTPAAQSTQQPSAVLALSMLIFGLKFAPPLDPIVRRQKLSEVFVLISQTPQVPSWLRQEHDLLWQREMQAPAAAPVVPPPPAQQPMQAVPTMQQTLQMIQQMQAWVQQRHSQPPVAVSQQQPTVQVVPPSVDPMAMMQLMKQTFDLFQQMQAWARRQQQPAPAIPQQQQPPAVQAMPPSADPMVMMQRMQQMVGLFQQMRASAAPPA